VSIWVYGCGKQNQRVTLEGRRSLGVNPSACCASTRHGRCGGGNIVGGGSGSGNITIVSGNTSGLGGRGGGA